MQTMLAAALMALAILAAAPAVADSGNNQSTNQLCRNADYADLHPTICQGPFTLSGGGGGSSPAAGGAGSGLLGGIPIVGGILKGLGL